MTHEADHERNAQPAARSRSAGDRGSASCGEAYEPSEQVGSPFPPLRGGRVIPSFPKSLRGASGDRGKDVHVAVGGNGGVEAFEVADVATVEHHGDEATDLAALIEQSLLERGMFGAIRRSITAPTVGGDESSWTLRPPTSGRSVA